MPFAKRAQCFQIQMWSTDNIRAVNNLCSIIQQNWSHDEAEPQLILFLLFLDPCIISSLLDTDSGNQPAEGYIREDVKEHVCCKPVELSEMKLTRYSKKRSTFSIDEYNKEFKAPDGVANNNEQEYTSTTTTTATTTTATTTTSITTNTSFTPAPRSSNSLMVSQENLKYLFSQYIKGPTAATTTQTPGFSACSARLEQSKKRTSSGEFKSSSSPATSSHLNNTALPTAKQPYCIHNIYFLMICYELSSLGPMVSI